MTLLYISCSLYTCVLGDINLATRNAVMDLNGHSSATTMHHYVHRNRHNQVTAVNNAFPRYSPTANVDVGYEEGATIGDSILQAQAPTVSTPPPSRSYVAPRYTPEQPTSALEHEDWGVDHPEFVKDNDDSQVRTQERTMRFTWTAEEVGWLRTWRAANPHLSASQCLRAIGESAEARRIFHRNHVQSSNRLDNGFKILKKNGW